MSKRNRIAFQKFLKSKGADLGDFGPARDGIDGSVGGTSISELMRLFANKNAEKITDAEIVQIARRLGASVAQVKAFAKVESGKSGFFKSGRPKILWERHYFWRRIRIKIPGISNPKPGGYTLDANRNKVNDSWEKLCHGCKRDPVAAFESASWGKFQVMGAHWKSLGYDSVFEFAWSMREGEVGHYQAFERFIRVNGLVPHLKRVSGRAVDNVPLVKRYNGPAYAKNNYHNKLARAYKSFA